MANHERPQIAIVLDRNHNLQAFFAFAKDLSEFYRFTFVLDRSVDISAEAALGGAFETTRFEAIRSTPARSTMLNQDSANLEASYSRLKRTSIGQIAAALLYLRRLARLRRSATALFERIRPALVLTQNDRGGISLQASCLKAARLAGIPIVIPYFSQPSDGRKIRIGKSELRLSRSSSWLFRLVMSWCKGSTQVIDGQRYLFYTPQVYLALKLFGAAPKNPWMIGTGLSDLVCLSNEFMRLFYIQSGGDPSRAVVIGDISTDSVFKCHFDRESKRGTILKKYGLSSTLPLVVVALPHMGEHGLCSWDHHLTALHSIFQTLSRFEINVLVSLHPKQTRANYDFIASTYNATLVDERMAEIIAVGDLFLSAYSSTIYWAILCGIPSIVVDLYNLNYEIYASLKSVSYAYTAEQLETVIKQLLTMPTDFEADWRLLSRAETFKGRTTNAYHKLFEGLMNGEERDATM